MEHLWQRRRELFLVFLVLRKKEGENEEERESEKRKNEKELTRRKHDFSWVRGGDAFSRLGGERSKNFPRSGLWLLRAP